MKIHYLFGMFVLFLLLYACGQGERIVDRPSFGVRNSETLEIDKIVLNDTATIFYMDAYFRPKYWIRIDSGTYLKIADRKFPIVAAEGIKLSDYHWMPETGESSFRLIFPPLPQSAKTVDFIESDCKECFKIFDIELQPGAGKTDTNQVPSDVKVDPATIEGGMPDPVFKVGKTKLTVHLLGYRKEIGLKSVALYLNEFLTTDQRELTASVDGEGVCRFEFDQYGPNEGFLVLDEKTVNCITAPGEEMEIWVDLGELSRKTSRYQSESSGVTAYYRGKYADLCRVLTDKGPDLFLQTHSEEFYRDIEGMTPEQYTAYVMQEYGKVRDSLMMNTSLTQMAKEYWQVRLRATAMGAILGGKRLLMTAYRIVNNIPWEQQKIDFEVPEFTDREYSVLKELDVNDSKMVFVTDYIFNYPGLLRLKNLENITGTNQGMLFDLKKTQGLSEQINNMEPLTSEQLNLLKSIENPFYSEVFQYMEQVMKEKMEANKQKTGYLVCDVPEVAKEKLFDAIVSSYKGKVVFVDFWATWCGPCRASIRDMEPLKETEFKGKDIVFVYLTGASSPMGTWQNMIPDIKGNHYRLNEEQWRYVGDQFGITGIPSYVLVDKTGKYKLRNDLRDHNTLKKVLLQEEAK